MDARGGAFHLGEPEDERTLPLPDPVAARNGIDVALLAAMEEELDLVCP
jgi:hypothetical protein